MTPTIIIEAKIQSNRSLKEVYNSESTILMTVDGTMSKVNMDVFKRILWGGVFFIGVGIILLADLPWESILILLGVIFLLDGLIRYYFEERGRV